MTQLSKSVKISLAIALIFSLQSFKSFSQTTRMNLMLNEVNANFNYGKSNSLLQPYKKDAKGVQFGLSFQAGITPMFSVVSELSFIMKGGVLKTGNPFTTNKSTLRLYTLELPVLARIHFGRVYFNSGPYVGYTLSGRMKTDGSETIPEKSTKLSFNNVPDGFRRWDMGLQAGAGYNFHIKKNNMALDLRYSYGLTNVSRDAERYNRVLHISLVVSNPWKKNPFGRKE